MTVDFFMLADAADLGEYGKINITGGAISFVELPAAPGSVANISVVARLNVEPADHGRTHTVQVRVADPEGAVMFQSPLTELPDDLIDPPHEPHEAVGIVFVGTLQDVTFPSYGHYVFSFELNGAPIAARILDVRRRDDVEQRAEPSR
jgi:hypothetical protein